MRSSSEIHWNKTPAAVTNVPHVKRMSVFMPVLGGKRRQSQLGKSVGKEKLSYRQDMLKSNEHINSLNALTQLEKSLEGGIEEAGQVSVLNETPT